jgi:hypothetical protein
MRRGRSAPASGSKEEEKGAEEIMDFVSNEPSFSLKSRDTEY